MITSFIGALIAIGAIAAAYLAATIPHPGAGPDFGWAVVSILLVVCSYSVGKRR